MFAASGKLCSAQEGTQAALAILEESLWLGAAKAPQTGQVAGALPGPGSWEHYLANWASPLDNPDLQTAVPEQIPSRAFVPAGKRHSLIQELQGICP